MNIYRKPRIVKTPVGWAASTERLLFVPTRYAPYLRAYGDSPEKAYSALMNRIVCEYLKPSAAS